MFSQNNKPLLNAYRYKSRYVAILVTGVGMMAAAFHLGKLLGMKSYDVVLNVGIAGSFSENIELGKVVNVTREQYGDLGAEDKSGFSSVFELGLMKPGNFPFKKGALVNDDKASNFFPTLKQLPEVAGISVNKAHGNQTSIAVVQEKFHPNVETMEGVACAFSCLNEGLPFCQIRAISNKVEPRNKNNWNIKLAVANLNNFLIDLFDHPVEN